MNIRAVNYQDFLRLESTFLSLDISIRSTGWVKSVDGVISWGTKALESQDELGRRREFREFLLDIIGNTEFPAIYVEDVIAGTNFKTTKGLIQLNTIVDDLKEYGLVKVGRVVRVDNKKWKKYLKQACNYSSVIKSEDDKTMIQNCLRSVGFSEDVKQDIYDAMGIALSMIYREKILKDASRTDNTLKKDIRKGYTIKQFSSKDKKFEGCIKRMVEKYGRVIECVDWVDCSKDVIHLFKQKIEKEQEDNMIYVLHVNNYKLGVLALTKKLDTEEPYSYLVVTKTK